MQEGGQQANGLQSY